MEGWKEFQVWAGHSLQRADPVGAVDGRGLEGAKGRGGVWG